MLLFIVLLLVWCQAGAQTITVTISAGPYPSLDRLHKKTIVPFVDSVNYYLSRGNYVVGKPNLHVMFLGTSGYKATLTCDLTPVGSTTQTDAKLSLNVGTGLLNLASLSLDLTFPATTTISTHHTSVSRRGCWFHGQNAQNKVDSLITKQLVTVVGHCNIDTVEFTDYNSYLYCREIFYKKYN